MLAIIYQGTILKRLRNAEHFDVFENIILHAQGKTIKPTALLPAWNVFLTTFGKEDAIYKRASKREETALIKKTHEKRKTSFMGFKHLLVATSYSETPAIKEAAELLTRVVENYAQANYVPMTEASALFVNLLQDLSKPKHADKIALITGAAEAVSHIERDNDAFMTLFAERTYTEGEEKIEGSMIDARNQTDQKFADLAEAINVFYKMNELQQPKDPEVSEFLSDFIVFINSYISKHESIYARRNPKYQSGSSKPSSPEENLPGEDGTPAETVPQLIIFAQEILGDSVLMPGFGTQMSLQADDTGAFAAALYPDAKNGVLKLTYPGTENVDSFPIADFLFAVDGTTPIGILVDAPNTNTFFNKPFTGVDTTEAEVFKGEEHLATLLGVEYPATMSEG
jgi:hypothetical protein